MAGDTYWRTRSATPSIKVSDLKEQDQELKIKAPRWSEDCKIKDEDQCTTVCLEEFTRVCVFFFTFIIGPCVQICQVCRIKSQP